MSDESLAILQRSTRDPHLPKSIRIDFVKKVYALVCVMLLITFAVASPFVFHTRQTVWWFTKHMWIIVVCAVFLIVQYLFHTCMSLQMCMGYSGLFRQYVWMFRTVPWNFLYCFVYASVFGVIVGFTLVIYTAESVVAVFLLTALIIVGLTAYAVWTETDFTGMGMYIVVALLGLLGLLFIGMFFPFGSMMHRIIGGVGAIIFGFIIVYDTQLIFGSAANGDKMLEFTLDMYAMAAFHLYLDFINFFLYMIRLLGERR